MYKVIMHTRLYSIVVAITLCSACNLERDTAVKPNDSESRGREVAWSGAPISRDQVNETLRKGDEVAIKNMLNDLKRLEPNFDVSELIACAYTWCDDRDELWQKSVLESPRIRIYLLDNLTRNERFGIEHDLNVDFRMDAIEFLSAKDPAVFRTAMFVLARVGEAGDADKIVDRVLSAKNEGTLRLAVTALDSMSRYREPTRASAASKAIDRLYNSVDERRQRWLVDALSRIDSEHHLVRPKQ